MRAFLAAALVLLSAVPTASADGPCVATTLGWLCTGETQGFGQCSVAVHSGYTEQCVLFSEGVFDSSGYYLIVCPLRGDVNLCVTDSSEDPVCVVGERQPVCL